MGHGTTPFGEMLHLIPRHIFQKLERRHACGRRSRKFGFREQFAVMAFVLLAASRSLRDALASLKEIKQFLKIRKFIGTNENAEKIQLYTALTVYLLMTLQKFLNRIGLSIGQIFQLIQLNLVGFRSIEDLLGKKPDKTKNPYDSSLLEMLSS